MRACNSTWRLLRLNELVIAVLLLQPKLAQAGVLSTTLQQLLFFFCSCLSPFFRNSSSLVEEEEGTADRFINFQHNVPNCVWYCSICTTTIVHCSSSMRQQYDDEFMSWSSSALLGGLMPLACLQQKFCNIMKTFWYLMLQVVVVVNPGRRSLSLLLFGEQKEVEWSTSCCL